MEYNIYCDESCHLQFDKINLMVLGGIRCGKRYTSSVNRDIIDLKVKFGLKPEDELKWTKISPSNEELFLALVDYFFCSSKLKFRGYVAKGKEDLKLSKFNGYNEWYYKIYYRMLEYILNINWSAKYNLYIDIKDTIGSEKISTLRNYLNRHFKNRDIVNKAQLVHSDHIAILQLTDIFVGALSYRNRGL